jgi:hypothetical protein
MLYSQAGEYSRAQYRSLDGTHVERLIDAQVLYCSGSEPLWDRGPVIFFLDEGPLPGRGPAVEKHCSSVSRKTCITFAVKENALVIPLEGWRMEGALTLYSPVSFWLPLRNIKSGLPQIDSSGNWVPSLSRREILRSRF